MAKFADILQDLEAGRPYRRPYKKGNGTWKPNRYIKIEGNKLFLYESVQIGDETLERKVDGHENGSDYIPVRWLTADDWEPWQAPSSNEHNSLGPE